MRWSCDVPGERESCDGHVMSLGRESHVMVM